MSRTKYPAIGPGPLGELVRGYADVSMIASPEAFMAREPKFLRLRSALLRGIETGVLRPGDRLPADLDLAEAFGVSLGTVQKALKTLGDESVVSRRQGVGTIIESNRLRLEDVWHFRFVGADGTTLLPLSARVLSVKRIRENGPWSGKIGEESAYIRIRRLITVDSRFNVYSELVLGAARFGRLTKLRRDKFNRVVIRNLLAEEFNLPILRPAQLLTAVRLPDEICETIGVRKGSHGISVEVVVYDRHGRPVYYQQIYWSSDAAPLVVG